jgi:hypothetical protein
MVQRFHGHGGVEPVLPEWRVEIGIPDQRQVLFRELGPERVQHGFGQVDSRNLRGGVEGEILFQFQAGAAAEVKDLAARSLRQQGRCIGLETVGAFDIGPHMFVIAVDPGSKEVIHFFQSDHCAVSLFLFSGLFVDHKPQQNYITGRTGCEGVFCAAVDLRMWK